MESAYVQGLSTRKVGDMLQGLGLSEIDTTLAGGARESKISRITQTDRDSE